MSRNFMFSQTFTSVRFFFANQVLSNKDASPVPHFRFGSVHDVYSIINFSYLFHSLYVLLDDWRPVLRHGCTLSDWSRTLPQVNI